MAEPTPTIATPPPTATDDSKGGGTSKLSIQLKKLNDANIKYKNLLKLAKERIQRHEEEAASWKAEKTSLEGQLEELSKKSASKKESTKNNCPPDAVTNILRVARTIRNTPLRRNNHSNGNGGEDIWALLDMEQVSEESPHTNRRYEEWIRFDSGSDLHDYIRRDTGEPLTVPPFSLSQDQAAALQEESERNVSKITEEFRRFRVKAELARKQGDAQLRELQSLQKQAPPGRDTIRELEHARSVNQQVERMKVEMAKQEAHWKEAYDTLAAENAALQSEGSEAMLASQWRQRYESCHAEKVALEERLQSVVVSSSETANGGDSFEQKYKDLKESFRLYRKKAKEIFEAQQLGEGGGLSSAAAMSITSNSSPDAKLSYLKNLMINYLTADPTVRDHMEGAIGTVLQFSPEERKRVKSKKTTSDSWF